MSYYTELNYEFRKGLFYVNALGAYEYQPDAIMDEKYLEGNKIIQTWDNQKNWQRVVASVTCGSVRSRTSCNFLSMVV